MVKLARWIIGFVAFAFSGGFIDGFVNQCYEERINVHALRERGGVLYGECLARDYLSLHHIARKNGGKLKIQKKSGAVFGLLKIRSRYGLITGGVIFICLLCFLSGFIWNVEITGNEKITNEELTSFLEENGVCVGELWKNVDKDKTENLIMASFDDCAWVHINESGTTARVEIREAAPKPDVREKTAANVKAKKDGLIVKTSVESGWGVAKKGDSVTKGDLLISGIYESEKKKGNQFAHASGEYIAEVKEKLSLTVARKQSYKAYKKERVFRKISFYGAEIPLYLLPYEKENSELEISCDNLSLNSNVLPIGLLTIKERRFDIRTKTLSDAKLKKLTESEIEKKLKEEFSDCEIIKRKLDVSLNSDEATVKGELICLEDIGEVVEIKIKNK